MRQKQALPSGTVLARAASGAALILALALSGCGQVQNLNPLGGIGGTADTARYNFESGAQGWNFSVSQATPTNSCVGASWAQGISFAGTGSLRMTVNSMNNSVSDTAAVSVTSGSNPPLSQSDLAGRTITGWVYAPNSIAPSTSAPSYVDIFVVDSSGNYANGPSVNMVQSNWVQVSFSPVASANGYNISGVGYAQAGFNPASVQEVGFKMGASGAAAATFQFTGFVYIDSVNW